MSVRLTFLDLRGQAISAARYEALKAQLPECEIAWDVPFQGKRLSETVTELTISAMTEEEQRAVLSRAHDARSQSEMHAIVSSLANKTV